MTGNPSMHGVRSAAPRSSMTRSERRQVGCKVLQLSANVRRVVSVACSPLNLQGSIRHSSSSLSSHTSSEAGNLVIMTDGLMGEHPEEGIHMQVGEGWRWKWRPPPTTDVFSHVEYEPLVSDMSDRRFQPSPSSSSLSSIRSNSSQIINSAPSSARGE